MLRSKQSQYEIISQIIREVKIQNYKSIDSLDLELGRVNVLIGENGCGKTNILEAIALASAAYSDKLDNEFLVSRGIRVTEPQLMRSAFDKENIVKKVTFNIQTQHNDEIENHSITLNNKNTSYSQWKIQSSQIRRELLMDEVKNMNDIKHEIDDLQKKKEGLTNKSDVENFNKEVREIENDLKKGIERLNLIEKNLDRLFNINSNSTIKNFVLF